MPYASLKVLIYSAYITTPWLGSLYDHWLYKKFWNSLNRIGRVGKNVPY